jgi:transposase-like protein
VLIAIGVDWEGRRQGLAVELANPENRSSRKEFLEALKARGLHGWNSSSPTITRA